MDRNKNDCRSLTTLTLVWNGAPVL